MKIVCDSNVLVRAALNPNGLAAELLRLIRASHVLVASQPLLVEVLLIMRRPKIQVLHGLDEHGIRGFISALYKASTIVHVPQPVPRVVPGNPKDDPILITAIGAKSNVLTTRDKHFFHADVTALAMSYGLRILSDDQLLTELRAAPTKP